MLELKNIRKSYLVGGESVPAISDVSVNFRKNEFVAVLGQSGSGKTTLLNIIGGLDKYDTGDLVINGRSTVQYRSEDWDAYRNHSVGFVFQNYNLISHQSVLSNVELALTLSGVSKSERRKRAEEVLTRVGLEDQMKKRPNQLSGGQMQRVAIARALINNPDILLADEPTGALDTETSIQIMDLIAEIAKDRLVIMVTHNAELAGEYANRIISLSDGKIINDTNPYTDEECSAENTAPLFDRSKKSKKNGRKTSMSFGTALSLSFNNLRTKRGRTVLTAFAGSIGIIGIALILAMSYGMRSYIASIETDTMASYPLMIEAESIDLTSIFDQLTSSGSSSATKEEKEAKKNRDQKKLYRSNIMSKAVTNFTATTSVNDLKAFKRFVESNSEIKSLSSDIKYGCSIDLQVYKTDTSAGVCRVNPTDMGQFGGAQETVWAEIVGNREFLDMQYEVLAGKWPENENELMLFVNKDNEISDYILYALGLENTEELEELQEDEEELKKRDEETQGEEYDFDEFIGLGFTVVPNTSVYRKDAKGLWVNAENDEAYMKKVIAEGIKLKITGIARPAKDTKVDSAKTSGLGYVSSLTSTIAKMINTSEVVKAQEASKDTDIFTGLPFEPVEEEESSDGEKEESVTGEEDVTVKNTSQDEYKKPEVSFIGSALQPKTSNTADTMQMPDGKKVMTEDEIYTFIDESIESEKKADMKEMVRLMLKDVRGISDRKKLIGYIDAALEGSDAGVSGSDVYTMINLMDRNTKLQLISLLLYAAEGEQNIEIPTDMDETSAEVKEEPTEPEIVYSDSTYEENLEILNVTDPEVPDSISIYPKNFEAKNRIKEIIDEYNEEQKQNGNESGVIGYTDYINLIMDSVTKIINVITYVLIAFVAISLVVSSIMIGVITRISVLERTKEIGILRAIGASKKDISHVFNSETIIIGFASGIMGILFSLLMTAPINAVISVAADIDGLVKMPPYGIIALIVISVLLTFIAGLRPSKSAAKKDPVEALRSE